MSTIFTKIINGEIPSYKVAENDDFLAFLDIQPIVKGHLLVIPKKETDYIFDIEEKELGEMMSFAKSVAKKMDKVFDCERIGMTVIGLEVPHAHIHLMPINGIADMDFNKEKLELSKEEMQAIAKSIQEA
ncbi:HIT family protein [Brumimicrobium salinarum]|uniref:HIT family protein n=1 Tax=Brumimicrobium salinarum TaxID=2058658 RepID=A0A2I0R3I2_9FLAO|nr:HIT family protein [Brumimicrobium salinarum]PKR81132.1 HIT family protein [Brumimicrobium salinarum]